jgi:capsid portal protein
MSAFMCNTADFATLAKFAIENQCQGTDEKGKPRKLARVANLLGAENARSVNYRYAHNPDAQEKFVLLTGAQVTAAALRDVSTVQIIKLCDCVKYQSCETADYESTPAYALLNNIRETAVSKAPDYSMSTYASAAWGLAE